LLTLLHEERPKIAKHMRRVAALFIKYGLAKILTTGS
jgi:hypothetical protein